MQICNYTSRKKNGGCRGGANHKPNRASFGSATSGYKRNPPAHHERVAKIYTKNKLSSFSVSWRQRRAPFNTAPPPLSLPLIRAELPNFRLRRDSSPLCLSSATTTTTMRGPSPQNKGSRTLHKKANRKRDTGNDVNAVAGDRQSGTSTHPG